MNDDTDLDEARGAAPPTDAPRAKRDEPLLAVPDAERAFPSSSELHPLPGNPLTPPAPPTLSTAEPLGPPTNFVGFSPAEPRPPQGPPAAPFPDLRTYPVSSNIGMVPPRPQPTPPVDDLFVGQHPFRDAPPPEREPVLLGNPKGSLYVNPPPSWPPRAPTSPRRAMVRAALLGALLGPLLYALYRWLRPRRPRSPRPPEAPR